MLVTIDTTPKPGTPTTSIRPWEQLPKAEQAKYRNEVDYVFEQDASESDRDNYFTVSSYRHALTALDKPFRLNTATMIGLASVGRAVHPLGGIVGLLTGMPLAFCAVMEGAEGFKHQDRRLIADAGFNLGIGVAATAGAFLGGPALLAAPALVAARELYFAFPSRQNP